MGSERRTEWTFDGAEVRWSSRRKCFRIMFSGDDAHRVQSVSVTDPGKASEIINSLDAGVCPTASSPGLWPVAVCPENAVPSDSGWNICRYAVARFDSSMSRIIPPTGYTNDPDLAVEEAMHVWDSMSEQERSSSIVMACEIADDFPATFEWVSCLWVSDPDLNNEGVWSGTLTVARSGNSAILRISQICDRLGLTVGDDVEVVIRRKR